MINKSNISRRMKVIGSLGKIMPLLLRIWEEFRSAKFRLPGQYLIDALLKTRSSSLNDKNDWTLLAETEGIINSRSL